MWKRSRRRSRPVVAPFAIVLGVALIVLVLPLVVLVALRALVFPLIVVAGLILIVVGFVLVVVSGLVLIIGLDGALVVVDLVNVVVHILGRLGGLVVLVVDLIVGRVVMSPHSAARSATCRPQTAHA